MAVAEELNTHQLLVEMVVQVEVLHHHHHLDLDTGITHQLQHLFFHQFLSHPHIQ